MSDVLNIDSSLPTENNEKLLDILLYGNNFNTITNQNILICTLKFIKDSHRFDKSLRYLYYSGTIFYFASLIIYDDVLFFCCSSQYILSISTYFNFPLSDQKIIR